MNVRRTAWLAALAVLCAGCPFLGTELEGFEGEPSSDSDRIPVVDDVGPFDPSEAVDDDDGTVVLADTDDPTDSSAFRDADQEGAAKSAAADGAENERGDGKLGEGKEHVADPAEVAAKKAQKEQAVEHADEGGGDEEERKAELDRNPPPEGTVESERLRTKVLDYFLETLLVAVLSALIAAALVFARGHGKIVAVASLVVVLLAWFLAGQRG